MKSVGGTAKKAWGAQPVDSTGVEAGCIDVADDLDRADDSAAPPSNPPPTFPLPSMVEPERRRRVPGTFLPSPPSPTTPISLPALSARGRARFPSPATASSRVRSRYARVPVRNRKSPTDPQHPSGCGQRWGSGWTEGQTGTVLDTTEDQSLSSPGLCLLPVPGPPSVPMIPRGEDAGQPHDPSGGGSPRDAKAIPLHVTPTTTPLTPSTLLVALSSPHIPDSGASHILLRSSSFLSPSHLPPYPLG